MTDDLRRVLLREERHTLDSRFLEAYLDGSGALHVAGQDLGQTARLVSDDGEYEYFWKVDSSNVPALRELLGVGADEDLLDALIERWSGDASYELERRLSSQTVPARLSVW